VNGFVKIFIKELTILQLHVLYYSAKEVTIYKFKIPNPKGKTIGLIAPGIWNLAPVI